MQSFTAWPQHYWWNTRTACFGYFFICIVSCFGCRVDSTEIGALLQYSCVGIEDLPRLCCSLWTSIILIVRSKRQYQFTCQSICWSIAIYVRPKHCEPCWRHWLASLPHPEKMHTCDKAMQIHTSSSERRSFQKYYFLLNYDITRQASDRRKKRNVWLTNQRTEIVDEISLVCTKSETEIQINASASYDGAHLPPVFNHLLA